MEGDEMRAAMGVGLRPGTTAEAITHAVEETRKLAPVRLAGLHTSARRIAEAGLREAAERLALDLHFHDDAALRAMEGRIVSHSERVMRLFGVGSVAEAAALAGAGEGAALLGAKQSFAGVSCAIALMREADA
jgi:cobalt-precorrin 5A hydrolase